MPADGTIEVLEFFAYTCPHCYRLESVIAPWSEHLSADVRFTRVPVAFSEAGAVLARAFYAIQALGLHERLHARLFAALHDQQLPLGREETLLDWLVSQGIDRARFAATLNAFGTQSRLARAKDLAAAYAIDSVPTLVVGDRYQTSAALAGSQAALPRVLDELIALVRDEARSGKG